MVYRCVQTRVCKNGSDLTLSVLFEKYFRKPIGDLSFQNSELVLHDLFMTHRLTFSLCYWRQVWTCYGKKSICFPHMDNERGWNECQDFHHRALEVYLVLVVLSSQFFNLPSTKHKRDAVITSPPFLWLLQLARCKMWSYLIFKYDAFQSEC